MNARTGEILAMATYPDYDLNAPFTLPDDIAKNESDLPFESNNAIIYLNSILYKFRISLSKSNLIQNLNNFILKIQVFKTYLAKFVLYNLSKLTFSIHNIAIS